MSGAILSPANPRIKTLAMLKKRSERDRSGLFLIEGRRELARAAANGVELDEVMLCEELAGEGEITLAGELGRRIPTTALGARAFGRLSHRNHPDGLVAVARQFPTNLDAIELSGNPLVLVVEAIEKPGNLGAMLRAADGAGVDAVIVADAATDIFNPNVVRASQGAVFGVPIGTGSSGTVVTWAGKCGLTLVAGRPEASTPPWQADLAGPVAIVVGSEHAGIGKVVADAAAPIAIPMAGVGDSLNTAMAAGLLLYEAIRQRSLVMD